ncbi:MAG: hypothetical protein A6F71_01300 [Cycloclasticus sp. symbiont of Poecilosclerida sp. M]|nr:MAG: hypothetical protein A6F71_01300 [Cycloclasticus sp. symbiont of Poecilosclerida sp. M]
MLKETRVLLINPYELGRQPFALAQATAWLNEADFDVESLDLSIQKLNADSLQQANLIGIYLGMHTATRIALRALPKIKECAPNAHVFAFGLYAPLNKEILSTHGVSHFFAGESEPEILQLAEHIRNSDLPMPEPHVVNTQKISFKPPMRDGLPALSRYAKLIHTDGSERQLGFIETTRGCKYLCRHCPVVPIYEGKFRAIPADIVLQDITQQVALGAEHISFGDPDFFNGPSHAKKILLAMHKQFPHLSFDATIKIEHVLKHRDLLPLLKRTGCLFITCAVESFNDDILLTLDKGHTRNDTFEAVELLKKADITISPTFVPFTPWSSLSGYLSLLKDIVALDLISEVAPIQLAIRLLIPQGSYLLKLTEFEKLIDEFDPDILGYPWAHQDKRVDALQTDIMQCVEASDKQGLSRQETFKLIWQLSHTALGEAAPELTELEEKKVPHLSEAWYCCAEPTTEQISNF